MGSGMDSTTIGPYLTFSGTPYLRIILFSHFLSAIHGLQIFRYCLLSLRYSQNHFNLPHLLQIATIGKTGTNFLSIQV